MMMKNENFNLTNLQTNQAMKKLLLFMAFAVTTLFSVSMHGQACVGPLTVTINGTDTGLPLGLSVSSQTNINCGQPTGSVTVMGTGGTPTYTYSKDGIDFSNMTGTLTGLTIGVNTITVKDMNGCTAEQMVTILNFPVTNTTDDLHFATIQAAIDAGTTANGEIITICEGTYAENVTVNKQLDIRGPKYNVAGNHPSRGTGEAIVVPAVSAAGGEIFMVKTSNVSINGLTIDGNNTALTSGWLGTNGADINAAEGVTIYDASPVVNNLTVSNNIIQNLGYFGVTLFGASDYSDANTSKTGHVISNNLIRNMGYYGTGNGYDRWGGGILLYNSHYAHVVDNVMTNVRIGIQTGNYQTAHVGMAPYGTISNNMIQTRYSGIFYNLHRFSPWTISGNTITGLDNATEAASATRPWRGMFLSSLGNNMGATNITNNTINGSGITLFTTGKEGINVWNVQDNAAPNISDGSITGVETGIFLNNYEGYASNADDGAHGTINDVDITATNIGVRILDSASSTTHAKVNGTVTNCTISGGLEGVKFEQTASGAAGGNISSNTISAAAAGINVTQATLSATNGLTIQGNTINMPAQIVGVSTPTVGIALNNITGSVASAIGTNNITGPYYGYVVYNLNTVPVTTINGGTITGIMQGVAAVNSVGGPFAPSVFNLNGQTMSGFSGNHPTLPNTNFHAGVYAFTGGPAGANSITSTISNVSVTGTGKIAQDCSGMSFADFSTGSGTMQNIQVRASTVNGNINRGLNVLGANALVDISTSTFDSNGGDPYGLGGNDGFGVIARQASVLTIDSSFIINPATVAGGYNVSALAADPGSAGSVSVTATHNSITLNGNVTSKLANNGGGTLTATCNWWGSIVPATVAAGISGVVTYIPWLTSGVDASVAVGFQPSVACAACAAFVINTATTPSNCPTFNDGTASVTSVTGGIAPYTYLWSNAAVTSAISGLVSGMYTVTITDAAGCTDIATVTVANIAGTVLNNDTGLTYCTIQGAIDAALTLNGHTIIVGAGTYAENVVVSKSVSILGPNAAIDPCSATPRLGEAIVVPAVSAISTGEIFHVAASNVTISGLTIDGDNTLITSGFTSTNGADIDAAEGVTVYETGVNNLTVTNNILKNLSYFGVTLYDYPAGVASSGHSIANNKMMDFGTYDAGSGISFWGGGVLLYNNQYAAITNNCMTNVRMGLQTGNFYTANPGLAASQIISGNTMIVRRRGIFHNLAYSAASPLTFSGNTITGVAHASESVWDGILLASLAVPSVSTGNIINGAGISNPSEGYEIWNVQSTSPASISGGSVSNVNTGIFANNYEGYAGDAGDGAHANVTGPMTITPNATGIGVRVLDSPLSTTHAKVNVSVSGVTISGGAEGVKFEQTATGAVGGNISSNIISAAGAGINVTQAALSATNGLTIQGNTINIPAQIVGASTPTVGIVLNNITGSAASVIGTNNITGPYYGYVVYNLNTTPVTTINGGIITGIMQGIAAVNSVGGPFAPSVFNLNGQTISGFTGNHPTLPNTNFHAGVYAFTGGAAGANSITSNISNVTVTGTGKIANDCAGMSFADFSTGAGTMQNIKVRASNVSSNLNRGVNVRGANALIDISTSTFDSNGGDPYGLGGNDGFGVIAREAAVVTIDSSFIINPATVAGGYNVSALMADPGTAGSVSVTATHNSITPNGNVTSKLANNAAGGTLNANCNWWGSACSPEFLPYFSGAISYTAWLVGNSDGPGTGFQPTDECRDNDATVTGPATACLNTTGHVYTSESGRGLYTWVVSGGTITSGGGAGDNTVTVSWNTTSGVKTVSVYHTNNGCDSPVFVYNVTVNPTPVAGTCDVSNDACQVNAGEIKVAASGGTGTLNVTWAGYPQAPFAGPVTGTPAGTAQPIPTVGPTAGYIIYSGLSGNTQYKFKVTDANGCFVGEN